MTFLKALRQRFHEDWKNRATYLKTHLKILGILIVIIYITINLVPAYKTHQKDTWGPPFDHTYQTLAGIEAEVLYSRGAGSGELEGCYTNYWTTNHQFLVSVGKNFCYNVPSGPSFHASFDSHLFLSMFLGIIIIPCLLIISILLYLLSVGIKSKRLIHAAIIPLDLTILILWFIFIPLIWVDFKTPVTLAPWRG